MNETNRNMKVTNGTRRAMDHWAVTWSAASSSEELEHGLSGGGLSEPLEYSR